MLSLYHHPYTDSIGCFHYCIGDLLGHLFLYLQAAGEHIGNTRNLGKSDDLALGQLGDMRLADKRQQVVLTH